MPEWAILAQARRASTSRRPGGEPAGRHPGPAASR